MKNHESDQLTGLVVGSELLKFEGSFHRQLMDKINAAFSAQPKSEGSTKT